MQAIVVQTFIEAPPEQVWRAVFERPDVLFDGLPADDWPAETERQEPVHAHAPWPWTESAGGPTEVQLTLHTLNGATRLDVRHQGWGEGPAWDAAIQGHFAGWLQGVAALGLMVETGRDERAGSPALAERERYFVSGELPGPPEAVYRAMIDPTIRRLWAGDTMNGLTLTDYLESRFARFSTASGGEATAIMRRTPRGTHLAIAEYGVTDRAASQRWPAMFESLARYLS